MECRRRPHAKKKQVWTEGIMAKAVSMCVYTYVLTNTHIRCVPWFVIITAKDDILGLSDQKCLYLYGSYSEMLRSCGCYSVCRKRPSANRASPVAERHLQERSLEAATGNTRAIHNRAAKRVPAWGDIFANLLRAQVCANWRQFHEIKLNL